MVRGARFPPADVIDTWVVLVLLLVTLVLVTVARDGVDLAAIPFTGWIHP